MKRNGTTSKGTTRWRCKQCGASSVKRRNDITNAAVFTQFIEHCTTAISLDDLAKRNGVSRATMKRRGVVSQCRRTNHAATAAVK